MTSVWKNRCSTGPVQRTSRAAADAVELLDAARVGLTAPPGLPGARVGIALVAAVPGEATAPPWPDAQAPRVRRTSTARATARGWLGITGAALPARHHSESHARSLITPGPLMAGPGAR